MKACARVAQRELVTRTSIRVMLPLLLKHTCHSLSLSHTHTHTWLSLSRSLALFRPLLSLSLSLSLSCSQGELVKGGAIRVLAKLRTSQCAIEADIADLGLKRLMSVASTRAAFSEEDLAAIEVSTRALKNTTQVASKKKSLGLLLLLFTASSARVSYVLIEALTRAKPRHTLRSFRR